ncbi:uncharacterized protein LOC128199437 [Bicyclus anynana]|uniref:Uncharacterized protein LOC128199437 n=1 Tax=Bicyclus anynana TaxID=110368 RepID=A0ABM3M0K2_BICAN|nr:uncharacterized protein LOC128199437 [Bicyclus anynana]
MHLKIREENLLKQFWELETEPNNIFQKKLTNEEIKCENFFQSTATRDNDGRYVVRLPVKKEKPECEEGQFRELASKRFYSTEKKLLENPKHYEEYQKVMKEYLSLNHMKLIESNEEKADSTTVYLSHHAVVKEDKDTTKVRIVFDATQKDVNNVSLNDSLIEGRKLQQDLKHLLMRWRCGKIAIVKMYRQVRVHDDDTKYQRILWRPDPNQPIQHYKVLTLTFGTAFASYFAVKCLQQIAKDERYKYQMAAEREDFYVDDLMTTCKTEKEFKLMYNEMNNLLHGSGFQLQKWSSNSENFLKYASEETTSSDKSIKIKANDTLKVLGITWNRTADEFEFGINLQNTNDKITKRRILLDIARLYDPMGWIAPVIVKAKIYIQKLWQANLDWDDTLPENLLSEWLNFRTDSVNPKNVKIPRCMKLTDNSHRELHAYVDASKSAYAAVIYLRTADTEGNVHVSLVTAKTKVAPIEKEVYIPRLELCGAVLAAKLLYEVSQVLDISINNSFAWTDTTVVLAWLRDLPNRWTTFDSNRVSEIINIVDYERWSHVTTVFNPADWASIGPQPSELLDHELWWKGLQWLHSRELECNKTEFNTHKEEKPMKTYVAIKETEDKFPWTKFSSLSKALRILSLCKRFLILTKLSKEERHKIKPIITTDE